MTRLSVCGLGVSCNEMNDNPMLLVVTLEYIDQNPIKNRKFLLLYSHKSNKIIKIELFLMYMMTTWLQTSSANQSTDSVKLDFNKT